MGTYDTIDTHLRARLAKLADLPPDIPATPVAGADVDQPATMDDLKAQGAPPLPDVPDPAPAAQPKPTQDPRLAAFLAKQAENAAALHAAQGKADDARRWAQLGNNFRRVEAIMLREKMPTADEENARLAQADRPVQQLDQQQKLESEGLKNYAAQQGVERTSREEGMAQQIADVNSPVNRRAAAFALAMKLITPEQAQNFTVDLLDMMNKGLTYNEAMAHHAATEAQAKAALEETRLSHRQANSLHADELAERTRHNQAEEAAKMVNAQKPLPPAEAAAIANHAEALKAIDQLEALHAKVGASALTPPGVHVGAEGAYHDAAKGLAPTLAGGLYPNGRGNPTMARQVLYALPAAIVSPERAHAAFDQMRNAVRGNAKTHLDAARGANYRAPQLDALEQALGQARPTAPSGAQAVTGKSGKKYIPVNGQWVEAPP